MQQVSRLLFAMDHEPLAEGWEAWNGQLLQLLDAVRGQFMQCEDLVMREQDAQIRAELSERLEVLNGLYNGMQPKLTSVVEKRNRLQMQQVCPRTAPCPACGRGCLRGAELMPASPRLALLRRSA
jgi:hypothetical protein